jgi:hypothetical protein
MTTIKQVRDLEEGDLVDLVPLLEKHFPALDVNHDISSYEYAFVESVEDFGAFVVLYTDQHNLSLPHYATVEVDDDAELADANISPDSEYRDTNIGGR